MRKLSVVLALVALAFSGCALPAQESDQVDPVATYVTEFRVFLAKLQYLSMAIGTSDLLGADARADACKEYRDYFNATADEFRIAPDPELQTHVSLWYLLKDDRGVCGIGFDGQPREDFPDPSFYELQWENQREMLDRLDELAASNP